MCRLPGVVLAAFCCGLEQGDASGPLRFGLIIKLNYIVLKGGLATGHFFISKWICFPD
jgi:hypothetical protein